MKLKNKIYLIQFFIIGLTLLFLFFYYNQINLKYQQYLTDSVSKTVSINTHIVKSKLLELSDKFKNREEKFKQLHQKAINIYKTNPSDSLEKIKKMLFEKCSLSDIDIDLFIIDKNYTITDSTFKRDIGFNLGIIKEAKIYLDKLKNDNDNNILIASNVVIDAIDSHIKKYSYSKIDENNFFEVGFKDKYLQTYLKNNIKEISNITNSKLNLYAVNIEKDLNEEYYKDITSSSALTKEEFFETVEKFKINHSTDNKIINSYRNKKTIKSISNNIYDVFIPIIFNDDKMSLFKSSLILNIKIDISKHQKELKDTKEIFYIFTFIIVFLMLLLYWFIKNHFYKPMSRFTQIVEKENKVNDKILLNKKDEFGILVKKYNKLYDSLTNEIDKNQLLLDENKQFIADMVHQIRTPLSVIMGNTSFIKMESDKNIDEYIDQINSSINMLSNSYEDLAYIVSNDKIEYKPIDLNLSEFLDARIGFFNVIAIAHSKTIITDIQKDIKLNMNDTELERLIDNNISNAIKHSFDNSEIQITLKKVDDFISLKFISKGKDIQNPSKLFEKNYTESNTAKRSLGLGLHMVKIICEKNAITYGVNSKNSINSFKYQFKI